MESLARQATEIGLSVITPEAAYAEIMDRIQDSLRQRTMLDSAHAGKDVSQVHKGGAEGAGREHEGYVDMQCAGGSGEGSRLERHGQVCDGHGQGLQVGPLHPRGGRADDASCGLCRGPIGEEPASVLQLHVRAGRRGRRADPAAGQAAQRAGPGQGEQGEAAQRGAGECDSHGKQGVSCESALARADGRRVCSEGGAGAPAADSLHGAEAASLECSRLERAPEQRRGRGQRVCTAGDAVSAGAGGTCSSISHAPPAVGMPTAGPSKRGSSCVESTALESGEVKRPAMGGRPRAQCRNVECKAKRDSLMADLSKSQALCAKLQRDVQRSASTTEVAALQFKIHELEESAIVLDEARRSSLRLLASVRGKFDAIRAESVKHFKMYEVASKALKESVAEQQKKANQAASAERVAARATRAHITSLEASLAESMNKLDAATDATAEMKEEAERAADKLQEMSRAVKELEESEEALQFRAQTAEYNLMLTARREERAKEALRVQAEETRRPGSRNEADWNKLGYEAERKARSRE
eukprot:6187085-Pleurochrysis_carterae.AAC.1